MATRPTRQESTGSVDRDALEWAIRRVVREAEPVRVGFFEADGQVFQRTVDYPDVELAFYDLSARRDPVREAPRDRLVDPTHADAVHGPAVHIRVVPDGARRIRICSSACHHIVADAIRHCAGRQPDRVCLLRNRFRRTRSARLLRFAAGLASTANRNTKRPAIIVDDQAYWTANLPPECGTELSICQSMRANVIRASSSAPVQLDPAVLRRSPRAVPGVGRSAIIGHHRGVRAAGRVAWCADGPEVVLDFPVSRRVASGVEDASRDGRRGGAAGAEVVAGRDGAPTSARTSTRGYEKRCCISGFRCTRSSASLTAAVQGEAGRQGGGRLPPPRVHL